ncbi:MAG: hypothetical protein ACK47B_28335 [Armatimonadota bacterium]
MGSGKTTPDGWRELLQDHGFYANGGAEGVIDLSSEPLENRSFLTRILDTLHRREGWDPEAGRFSPTGPSCTPEEFADAYLAHAVRGPEGEAWQLGILEPRIAALVRVLNELGLTTVQSCEGHLHPRGAVVMPMLHFQGATPGAVAGFILSAVARFTDCSLGILVNREFVRVKSELGPDRPETLKLAQRFLQDAARMLREHEPVWRASVVDLEQVGRRQWVEIGELLED